MSAEPTPPPHPPRPDYLLAATCAAVALAAQLPFITHQAVLLDEGVILQMGDDITHGKVPYRDGVHYAFPGVFYLTALVFEIFGPSLEAARLLAASLFSLAVGASVLICRWWCTRPETLVFFLVLLSYRVWAFPHWHMLNYSPLAVTMALVATWATGEHLARSGYRWALLAGVFLGFAILAKQDSGGASAIALGIAVLALRPSTLRQRLLGGVAITAAASAVVLGGLFAVWNAGYFGDLVREALYGPLYGVTNYEYLRRPSLWPLLSPDQHLRDNRFSYFPQILMESYGNQLFESRIYRNTGVVDGVTKLIYHAPWMAALAATVVLASRAVPGLESIRQRRRILVLLLAFAYLIAFNPPHDWIHLLVLYPPTLFLAAAAIPVLRSRPTLRAAAGLLCAGLFAFSVHLALEFRAIHSERVETARGAFYTRPAWANGFRDVLRAIEETPPETPLLAYPYHPFLNFLADRPGATRYLFLWPVEWNDKRDDEIIAALESRPDTTVLYSLSQLIHLGSPRDFAARLFSYLTDNYAIDRSYGITTPGLSFLQLRREAADNDGSLLEAITEQSALTKTPRNGSPRHLEDGRERFLRISDWPFRKVAALKTQPAAEVALRIPIQPRGGDLLSTSYATNPEHWEYLFSPPVRFRLAISEADGTERTLLEREIQHGNQPEHRRWFDVTLDLSPWAGRSVDLVLGVFTRWGTKPSFELAAWQIPTIEPHSPTTPERTTENPPPALPKLAPDRR